jgi:hypothetical protein
MKSEKLNYTPENFHQYSLIDFITLNKILTN